MQETGHIIGKGLRCTSLISVRVLRLTVISSLPVGRQAYREKTKKPPQFLEKALSSLILIIL